MKKSKVGRCVSAKCKRGGGGGGGGGWRKDKNWGKNDKPIIDFIVLNIFWISKFHGISPHK